MTMASFHETVEKKINNLKFISKLVEEIVQTLFAIFFKCENIILFMWIFCICKCVTLFVTFHVNLKVYLQIYLDLCEDYFVILYTML